MKKIILGCLFAVAIMTSCCNSKCNTEAVETVDSVEVVTDSVPVIINDSTAVCDSLVEVADTVAPGV